MKILDRFFLTFSEPLDALCRWPKMDGFEFLTKLRQHGFNLPFIFMTAAPTTENLSRAADLGIKNILEKPFSVEDLQLCLNKILHLDELKKADQ